MSTPYHKRGRGFQNDLDIFYLLQLIVKKYQNSFLIFYAKINRKMIGYFDSKVVLEPTLYGQEGETKGDVLDRLLRKAFAVE